MFFVLLLVAAAEAIPCQVLNPGVNGISVILADDWVSSPYFLLNLDTGFTSLKNDSILSLYIRESISLTFTQITLELECSPSTNQYVIFNLTGFIENGENIERAVIRNPNSDPMCIRTAYLPLDSVFSVSAANEYIITGTDGQSCVKLFEGNIGVSAPCWNFLRSPRSDIRDYSCACNAGSFPLDPDTNGRCERCPAGSEDVQGKGEFCTICAAGRYELDGECQDCAQGLYSTVEGRTVCTACASGTFSNVTGASSGDVCLSCERGTFSMLEGQSACIACSAGKYSLMGFSSCVNCSVGEISGESSFGCDFCSPGTYNDIPGSEFCKSCTESSTSPTAATSLSQCFCPEGFYGAAFKNQECFRCPRNNRRIFCAPNVTYPDVGDGYLFLDFPDPNSLVQCLPRESCIQREDGQTVCGKGYKGDLCGDCSQNYYRVGNRCQKCPSASIVPLLFLIFLFLLFCLVVVRFSVPFGAKSHSLAIWLSWVQILSLYSALPVEWPPEIKTLFDIASFVNFNIELFSPGCSASVSYWQVWYFKLLFPIIFALGLLFIFAVHCLLRNVFPDSKSYMASSFSSIWKWLKSGVPAHLQRTDPSFPQRYIYAYVMTITYIYTIIAQTPVAPLNCVKKDNGEYRMLYNQDVICYEGYWLNSVLPSVIVFSILYLICIPLAVIYILRVNEGRTSQIEFLQYYGGLTLPYRESYKWFEIVNMGRKALMAIMIDFCSILQTAYLQVFATLGIAFIFLMTQFYMSPYALHFNNHLSFVWIAVSIFCLFSGLIFINPDIQSFEKAFFSVLVYTLFSFACVVSIWVLKEEILFYRSLSSDKSAPQGKNAEKLMALNMKRNELISLFPRSHKDILTHIALLKAKRQEEFFKDCDDLQNQIPENIQIYSNPLLTPDDPKYDSFAFEEAKEDTDATIRVKVSPRTRSPINFSPNT